MFTNSMLRFAERPGDCPVCHSAIELAGDSFILFHCGQGFMCMPVRRVNPTTHVEETFNLWRPGAISPGRQDHCANAFILAHTLITDLNQKVEKLFAENESPSNNNEAKPAFGQTAKSETRITKATRVARKYVHRNKKYWASKKAGKRRPKL